MRGPAFLIAVTAFLAAAASAEDGPHARQVLSDAGVRGGLVVHLGCGDGKLTVTLRVNDSYVVHGLDRSEENVRAARRGVGARGMAGGVCFAVYDGRRLPYVDNLVNLLVAEDLGSVPMAEVMRVLAPEGVAWIGGRKTVKPRPKQIDEWTHYLHDASNNAVAQDAVIGPPRHLQWQGGPKWSRHHDHMASMSAMVSAGGRVFYILDEGSRVSPQLPSRWRLVARDAFNGVLLWKRPIEQWHPALWPLKSGPANLPRRLVAKADTVYATLGIAAPVAALDAATGKTVREYAGSAGAEEIVLADGVLLALVNRTPLDLEADRKTDAEAGKSRDGRTTFSPYMSKIWAGVRSRRWGHGDRTVLAFDAATGKPLWQRPGPVVPLTLAADAERVYFHNGERIVALGRETGKPAWESEPVAVWQGLQGQGLQSWFAPTLVVHDGRVLLAGGEKIHMSYVGWATKDIGQDTMTAFSAETGRKLWTADHPYSGYNSPEDLFAAAGRVWAGKTAKGGDGRYVGHDPQTGKLVSDFPPTVQTFWFHHRCHRAKATDRYILSSRTGIEFVDLKTGEWTIHHWVRGGCLYGIMPANGMIYAPPSPCACYPEALLHGFTALAPVSTTRALPKELPPDGRLTKGPACSEISNLKSQIAGPRSTAWPTYRADPARSGGSGSAVPPALKRGWTLTLGGKLTQAVVGGGRLFVADVDAGLVHAVDAATGEKLWTHAAGGRVDSSPTYHRGRLLFGSADGYVTALRASDGALAWRFRAAPIDRRLVAFGQVESVWPVHGSVLVQDPSTGSGRGGVATVVAGRSMYLDGGLRLCRLDAATGTLLSEKVLDDRDPETGENLQVHVRGLNMPVALPDILSSDGENLYMRSQAMDREGNRRKLGPGGGKDHLFAAYGFTDDSWFHRTYWLFGNGYSGGVGGFGNAKKKPAGLIMAFDAKTIFGYGRKPAYYRWCSAADYQLYAAPRAAGGEAASSEAMAVYFKNTPSLDPTGKPMTIAAWVKPDAPDGTVLVRGANANGFALILTAGRPRMLLRTKGKTHEAVSSRPIRADWTHVAGVLHADGRMEVYVNGERTAEAKGVPSIGGEPMIEMKVGYDDTNQLLPKPLSPFRGALDEVMLFHRALDTKELRTLAQRGGPAAKPPADGLVLHLAFEGGKTRDRSPQNNHGRLEGGKARTVTGPCGEALVLTQPKALSPAARAQRGKSARNKSAVAYRWTRDLPIMARAMALAGPTLFVAGPEHLLDEVDAFQRYDEQATQKRLADQDAALAGRRGAMLHAVHADTGETLAEYTLDAPPVFDGLSAAGGRLYLSLTNGTLQCWSGK